MTGLIHFVSVHTGLRTKSDERKKSRYKGKEDLHSQLSHEQRVIKIKNHRRNLWRPGHLLSLDISGNDDITDTSIGVFVAVFHKIVYLNIGNYVFFFLIKIIHSFVSTLV